MQCATVYLFVSWITSYSKIFTDTDTSPLPIKAIEQLVFSSVPHELWHGSFIYIGHLYEPVTPAPVTVAVKLSIPVLFWLEPLSHADQANALF